VSNTRSIETSACEHCGQIRPIMFAMEPGFGGAYWHLCSTCYLQGIIRPLEMNANVDDQKKPAPDPTQVEIATPSPKTKGRATKHKRAG
jgi:hypothetical protein